MYEKGVKEQVWARHVRNTLEKIRKNKARRKKKKR